MVSPSSLSSLVVYTDLDGTLLDHHSYSHAAAKPALEILRAHDVPVVLASSKTFPELVELAGELSLKYPVIGENGAFVAWPVSFPLTVDPDRERAGYRFRYFGRSHDEILKVLQLLRRNRGFAFSGFSDWRTEELMARTGLTHDAAERAAQREASEPILWQGSAQDLQLFRRVLEGYGLALVKGGRFFHVMGRTSKRDAMCWLHAEIEQMQGRTLQMVALGDGPNDVDMLAAADIAVVVANPDSDAIAPPTRHVLNTTLTGPAGWNEAILQIAATIQQQGQKS